MTSGPQDPPFTVRTASPADAAAIVALIDLNVASGELLPRTRERSLAVSPDAQGLGVGIALIAGLERLARVRGYATLFAVSNSGEFFRRRGFDERHIPELDRERSSVSRYKGVHAKDLAAPPAG